MDLSKLPPITTEEIEDLRKDAERWYDHHWGATMDPARSRGMAKDVVRLVARLNQVEAQLNKRIGGANTDEDFENNPCTMCGSPPAVRCDHDE